VVGVPSVGLVIVKLTPDRGAPPSDDVLLILIAPRSGVSLTVNFAAVASAQPVATWLTVTGCGVGSSTYPGGAFVSVTV